MDDGRVRGAHPKLVDFGLGDACMAERERKTFEQQQQEPDSDLSSTFGVHGEDDEGLVAVGLVRLDCVGQEADPVGLR